MKMCFKRMVCRGFEWIAPGFLYGKYVVFEDSRESEQAVEHDVPGLSDIVL
jgi:hypothetical protein